LPEVSTRLTTQTKLAEVFWTVTPNCLASGGSSGGRGLEPVLHLDGGDVLVDADVEGRGDPGDPVAGAVRGEVQHPLDAVDLLLNRRGGGLGHRHRVGPRVGRRDQDLRGGDLRVQTDRQQEEADPPIISISSASTVAKIGRPMKKLTMRVGLA
jgi:hypothetical protein